MKNRDEPLVRDAEMAQTITKVAEESTRGSLYLFSGTALATVTMAVASILIGRLLGPELYGQYTIALTIPQFLFIIADLGINQGIIKFTATYTAKGETAKAVNTIKQGLILKTAVGTVLFLINFAFADILAATILQRPELALQLKLISTSIIFQTIFTTITSASVGLDKTEYNAFITEIQALAKTIISITLVLMGLGVAGALIGYSTSYVIASIVGVITLYSLTRKLRKKDSAKADSTNELRKLVKYSAPLYISILLAGLIPFYQNILLAIFTTDTDIGNYKAAINFVALTQTLSTPITTALLPAFSKLELSTKKNLKTFFKLANKYTAYIMIPATILIITYSTEIVQTIYGSTYQTAPLFLTIHSTIYLLVGIGYLTLTSFYNGQGETKTTLTMGLITFATLAILSPPLTKTYSIQGLITAFVIATATGTIYAFNKARKKFQLDFERNSLLKIYAISIVSAAPSILITHLASPPKLINLTVGAILYLAIYITLTPLSGIVNQKELRMASTITSKTRPLKIIAKPFLDYQQGILRKAHRR
jgi:O-antigen/teichoic acid export membrane protein